MPLTVELSKSAADTLRKGGRKGGGGTVGGLCNSEKKHF